MAAGERPLASGARSICDSREAFEPGGQGEPTRRPMPRRRPFERLALCPPLLAFFPYEAPGVAQMILHRCCATAWLFFAALLLASCSKGPQPGAVLDEAKQAG